MKKQDVDNEIKRQLLIRISKKYFNKSLSKKEIEDEKIEKLKYDLRPLFHRHRFSIID